VIVIDTSALIALLANEPLSQACRDVFEKEELILISAGTMLEALIVSAPRGFSQQMRELLSSRAIQVIDVTPARAERAADAYTRWGKGFHRAALNYGDCFAYAAAREFDCPLLYIGNDFIHTDITAAISAPHP
jgi:ribonuclease VapC